MTDTTDQQAVAVAQEDRPISEHPCHGLFSGMGDKLAHRHWFQANELMPTCERCGTPIGRDHKETGPISWVPEKRRETVTLDDRYALSNAAMNALAEWLAWPDAGRDGPREVTVAQTLSFLRGLPNTLGYGKHAKPPEPVPATNQAGEVDAGDIGKVLAWAITGKSAYGIGLLRPIIEHLCRAALATQPATLQEGEAVDYRALLIQAGRNAGAFIDDRASDAFLKFIPEEVRLKVATLAATPMPPTLSEDLREALKPFADIADFYDSCEQHPNGCPDSETTGEMVDLTVGDFRRARAALALAQVKAS